MKHVDTINKGKKVYKYTGAGENKKTMEAFPGPHCNQFTFVDNMDAFHNAK